MKKGQAKQKEYWDKSLFYKLEDIDQKSEKDGILNTYNVEAKTLLNKETGNKIDYMLYRNPNTNRVNKIVSMEYLDDGEIETVDYYFTDEGKVNFIFFHTVTEYTPSYATRNKPGERFYFADDAMVKWRITTVEKDDSIKELNYVATKAEWGDQKKCAWWSMLKDTSPKIQKEFQEKAVRMLNAAYNTYYAVVDTESINLIDGSVTILLSPVLADGEVRIVLDWGAYPNDLDAHLFTPYDGKESEDAYHIWYGQQEDPYGNNLDVDDTDGFGPETMTIRNLENGCYKYYVADFTNCSNDDPTSYEMSESGAQVNVYTSEGEVQTFYVPANRSGVIWEVFEIRNGRINRINHYYNQIEDKPWWHQEK